MNEKWFYTLLRCPHCGGELQWTSAVMCRECGFHDEAGKDLRPREEREFRLVLSGKQAIQPTETLHAINTTRPRIAYVGPNAIRDSRELMTEIMSRLPKGSAVLDLGCGPRDQFVPLDHLGFRYVGIDYVNDAADLLADAHAIPFKDGSFDCVFSYAVLEHLHNPFIAICEVSRVLKPGSWFIGTVSQGEPFHGSYFHLTPWGLISLVSNEPRLRLVKMWDSSDTLQSLSVMGRYSRVLKVLLKGLNCMNDKLPWLTPRKMLWTEKEKQLDRLYRAGSLCFVIEKF